MNTVQYLNDFVDRQLIQKLFVKFANKYGSLWLSRLGANGDWRGCEDDWLQELSVFTARDAISAFKQALIIYKDFPPTQGQIIDLCMKESGVPEVKELINLMISRDFNHPLVKMIYDKIGSWELSNGKSSDIERKVKEYYNTAKSDFYSDPQKAWENLNEYNSRPKELPAPPKNPTKPESEAFKKFLDEAYACLGHKKSYIAHETYTVFDEDKIKKTNKAFDPVVFEEYKNYLLSIPETETLKLPPKYVYDRSRFIGAQEQPQFLRERGFCNNDSPTTKGQNCEPPRRSNGPQKMYKNWASD